MKTIKSLVMGTPLEKLARVLLNKPKTNPSEFKDSRSYWEERYARKGNSGSGSYGRLAEFKARILNKFVEKENIQSVIEFGCGDGSQTMLAKYPTYIGYDVSHKSIELCKAKFPNDKTKHFFHVSEFDSNKADLTLSLDVIYHLVEDDIYEKYMRDLFNASSKFVVIYASNFDESSTDVKHVRHRNFTNWVKGSAPEFSLIDVIKNEFPFDETDPDNTSFADFYVFEKR